MTAIDSALGQAAAWAAAAVCLYLAVGLAATFAARSAGTCARVAGATLLLYPRIARSAMRATVVGVVGLGASVGGTTAAGADAPAPPAPPARPLVAPANPPAEPLDWPMLTMAPTAPAAPAHHGEPSPASVVVHRGDSLWQIAARSLGRRATTSRTAAAWPRWWAANRVVIGDDPDLLRPGLVLRAPRLERSGR